MQLIVFENAHFLQSLGWAIVNSIWQAGLVWFLYRLIIFTDKKQTALLRYNIGLVAVFASFSWLVLTFLQAYRSLQNPYFFPTSTNNHDIFIAFINKIIPYCSIIYLCLLAFCCVKFLKKYIALKILQKNRLSKVPVDIRMFVDKTSLHLGIKNKVQVWFSEHVDIPSVLGFTKPMLLLPVSFCNHLTTEQMEAVLLHELAHIKRNDYLINLIQTVIGLILFFNPFIHLLNKYIRNERENCCDDWVMNYQFDKYSYASALLKLEEQRLSQLAFVMCSSNNEMNLLNRIKRLNTIQSDFYLQKKQSQRLICIVFCLLIFISISFFSFPVNNPVEKTIAKTEKKNILVKIQRSRIDEDKIQAVPLPITTSYRTPVVRTKNIFARSKNIKKSTNDQNGDYTISIVNKDLENENSLNKIISVADIDDSGNQYFIKITEQQSGSKSENVYYFELNNNNGKTGLKPILFQHLPLKNIVPNVLNKKRITS